MIPRVYPGEVCTECGLSHDPARRQRAIRRLLPADSHEIRDAYPCWYGGGPHSAGNRMLFRDLHSVGAVRSSNLPWSTWRIPNDVRVEPGPGRQLAAAS